MPSQPQAYPLKPHRLGVLACLLLAIAPGAAYAEADGPDFFRAQGIAAHDTLNIRSAPNPRAAKRGEIPPEGACIRNLGCQGGLSLKEYTELSPAQQAQRLKQKPRWCKVEYQGITGWVAGRYLTEGACP
jgi:uncharacterized protein YraI